jgi:type I restriction enzyme S subunit
MKSKWIRLKLKDACDQIFSGGTPDTRKSQYWNGTLNWMSSGETRNKFIRDTDKKITQLGVDNSSTKLAKVGDVLIASAGQGLTRGQTSFCLKETYINQSIISLRANKNKLKPLFLFYLLTCKYKMLRDMSDANSIRGSLTCKMFENIEISIPEDLIYQETVSNILFKYDLLIENNTSRIGILEKMGKLIYDEWFVKFKFPGHEKIKMVDSEFGKIPEEWEIKTLKEVADIIDCLHSKKPKVLESGSKLFLQLENIGEDGKIELSKKFYISNEDYQKWISRIEVREGDCVITNVGRVGAVAQIPSKIKAAMGRNMTAIRPKEIPPSFLIQYLLSKHMSKQKSAKVDSGTIMDALNVRNIYKLSITIPDKKIMKEFDDTVEPIRKEINNLLAKNIVLSQIRDFLLPKLISGMIDATDLKIKVSEVEA